MISKRRATVLRIISENDCVQVIEVLLNDSKRKAYNYIGLTGKVKCSDDVLLNTTAVELSLGTGGVDFVIANLNNLESNHTDGGHIMKLRYTPIQMKVDSVEEQSSRYHDVINKFENLDNLAVVVGALHSILPPFCATFKEKCPDKKLIYIMSDAAALPISFSQNVDNLKSKGLIDATITCGNAFGGDYECINIYTALITAKEICKADCVIVAMGPGIAGTGTKYGFSGIDQGMITDAIETLGGDSYIIPRISFADMRQRHKGISHHSLTILSEITNKSTNIVINTAYDEDKLEYITNQIQSMHLQEKHNILYSEYRDTEKDLEKYSLKVKSMGRGFSEDREFFEAASAVADIVSRKIMSKNK